MKFLDQIKSLNLSQGGVLLSSDDKKEVLSQLEKELIKIPGSSVVLLREKDPVRFIFAFFWLLENGHTPVSLPADMNDYQFNQISIVLKGAASYSHGIVTPGTGKHPNHLPDHYASITSGTTGVPKLCFLKVQNALENARAHCQSLQIEEQDQVIQSLPLYHSYGIVAYLFGWLEMKFTLDLNLTFLGLRALKKRSLSRAVLHISPAQLRFMLKEKCEAPEGLKLVSVGGGLADRESLEEFSKLVSKTKLFVTYGLTEAGPRVSTGLWQGQESGYIGEAIPGVEVRVLVDGEARPSGTGKLLISSPSLKKNLHSTEIHENSYLLTRDHVFIDEKGSVFFRSRADDLINFGGISVYPMDIEAVVKKHNQVLDAIVLKTKSKFYEEEPVLFVEPEIDAEELREFMKEKLSLYQMPKQIITMKQLPRTSLHKVDRKALLESLEKP